MILLLLVSLAEALVQLHSAGSWAGLEGIKRLHSQDWPFGALRCGPSLSLFGRLACVSLQYDNWLPRGRK